MNTPPATTLHVSIARDPDDVYSFAANPENLPVWAPSFCQSIRRDPEGPDWIMTTPAGPMGLRMTPPNSFRVLDHTVTPAPGVEVYVPMRVLARDTGGSEVLFTLFRPAGMTDEKFAADLALVRQDLATLKRRLET